MGFAGRVTGRGPPGVEMGPVAEEVGGGAEVAQHVLAVTGREPAPGVPRRFAVAERYPEIGAAGTARRHGVGRPAERRWDGHGVEGAPGLQARAAGPLDGVARRPGGEP